MMIAMEDVPAADAGLGFGDHPGLDPALGGGRTGRARHDRHRPDEFPRTQRASRSRSALSGGYHLAFLIAAGAAAVGILIALFVLRSPTPQEVEAEIEEGAPVGVEAESAELQAA